MTRAVFLDRDGTIIEQVHHLTDPDDVALINGAGEAIAQLRHVFRFGLRFRQRFRKR